MTAELTYAQGIDGPVLADLTTQPLGWRTFALCTEIDADLFHHDSHGGEYTKAKAICDECPVKDACLDYALSIERRLGTEAVFGVFGGLNATERIRILVAERVERGLPPLPAGADPEEEKPCKGCGRVKPITGFNVDQSTPDGRKYRCRACTAEQCQKSKQRSRERRAA